MSHRPLWVIAFWKGNSWDIFESTLLSLDSTTFAHAALILGHCQNGSFFVGILHYELGCFYFPGISLIWSRNRHIDCSAGYILRVLALCQKTASSICQCWLYKPVIFSNDFLAVILKKVIEHLNNLVFSI